MWRRALLAVGGPSVLVPFLFASTVTAAAPDDPVAANAAQDARVQAAFSRFDAWLQANVTPGKAAVSAAAASEGVALAQERRRALLQLAKSDPRQALGRALAPSVLKRLPPAVQEQSESYADVCGSSFGLEIGDNFDGGAPPVSRVTRTVTVAGRTYEAQVFGRRAGLLSKEIHANGIVIGDTFVLYDTPLRRMDPEEAAADPTVRAQCVPGPGCIAVKVGAQTLVFRDEASLKRHQAALEKVEDVIDPTQKARRPEALDPHGDVTINSAHTTGDKTLLYMRVDFSDLPGDPVAADAAQSTVDTAVSTFLRETSYNRTSMRATVTPTMRMPRTSAEYLSIGDGQLLTDARAAATAAGYVHANFNFDLVAFARLFPGYSGKARVGAKGLWLNGSFGSGVTAHELGHNYGLHHANLWQTTDNSIIGPGANVEYGNVFDVMGRGGIRGQFNAWFKSRLDWLLPAEYTNVTASGTFRIDAVDDPAATGQRALRIVKDTTKNYWVEFRRAFTTNRWAMNGVTLNWGYNRNTGSHLLDTTPGSSNNQNDAPLLMGRTFSDPAAGVHITPIARAATPPTMDVVVNLGTFPSNTPPTGTLTASSTDVARNVPVTLTVSASDGNGDALAYGWVFDDGTIAPNSPSVSKSWSTAGAKVVTCLVTDMVGGVTPVSVTVNVGAAPTFSISGRVTTGGQPLAGVVVTAGARSGTTDAAGNYTIVGLPAGTYTLTPALSGFTFEPATLSATVTSSNLTNRNFVANAVPANIFFEAHFDAGADGLTYVDDAFRATAQPAYASGGHVATGGVTGGALRVLLGGVDATTVTNMSGGWRLDFTLAQEQPVAVSFRFKITQTADYESDEVSEMLGSLNGVLIGPGGVLASVAGNGNGGTPRSVGYQLVQGPLGTFPAGTYSLILGGFNNKKTLANESTEVLIDDLLLYRP
jgi:hypothetical protein